MGPVIKIVQFYIVSARVSNHYQLLSLPGKTPYLINIKQQLLQPQGEKTQTIVRWQYSLIYFCSCCCFSFSPVPSIAVQIMQEAMEEEPWRRSWGSWRRRGLLLQCKKLLQGGFFKDCSLLISPASASKSRYWWCISTSLKANSKREGKCYDGDDGLREWSRTAAGKLAALG